MRIQWHGQSAFDLAGRVFIDPFHDVSSLAARGMQFDYPAIEGAEPELLLVTHEHLDHNGVEAIGGSPAVLRSTAGTLESPIGEVVAVASEHDEVAGTQRGPNTDLRLHSGWPTDRALRRLRPDGAARRAGRRDRAGRPRVRAGRRRADDRRRPGARTRRHDRRALGRADALPDAADRLPRDRRRVPGAVRRRRRAVRGVELRDR